MQVCHIVLGSGTAFDEMKIGSFIHNNQSMFKLSGTLGIQSEIRL